jgi:hypothetical protein
MAQPVSVDLDSSQVVGRAFKTAQIIRFGTETLANATAAFSLLQALASNVM